MEILKLLILILNLFVIMIMGEKLKYQRNVCECMLIICKVFLFIVCYSIHYNNISISVGIIILFDMPKITQSIDY